MMGNGNSVFVSARVNRFGRMAASMRVTGRTTKLMGMDD